MDCITLQLLSPAPSPGVCSSSCPLSQWWYLTISSSASLFSFCAQSFPASRSFPILCVCVCVCVCISYISKKNWQNCLDAFAFPDPLLLLQQLSFRCVPFYSWVIFRCVYGPQLSYPFVCWWTSRLLPCPSYKSIFNRNFHFHLYLLKDIQLTFHISASHNLSFLSSPFSPSARWIFSRLQALPLPPALYYIDQPAS